MRTQRTAPETAPDQAARLLALVPYLLARGEVRLEEAAAHFQVSSQQLDKDLRVLFMTGLSPGLPGDLIEVDIDALEGDGVIRVDNADYLARPVRFTPAEATALIVALRTMGESAQGDPRAVLARTLEKLEQAVGADSVEQLSLHVAEQAPAGHELVPAIERAIAAGQQLRLDYHVPSRDERSRRVVDPRAVARVENVLYLDAWCHEAGAERAFRLERILELTELDTPVADPLARSRDLTQGWFNEQQAVTVTLRLESAAFWVGEYFPVTDRREGPDGTLDVDLAVADEAWLTRLVLRLTPHARVLQPASFAETVDRVVSQTLRLYE